MFGGNGGFILLFINDLVDRLVSAWISCTFYLDCSRQDQPDLDYL